MKNRVDKVPLMERRRWILDKRARERMERGRPKQGQEPRQNFTEDTEDDGGRVNESLAEEIGVSRPTYEALKVVTEQGTPELVQAVRAAPPSRIAKDGAMPLNVR